jgi:two-component system, LytTR family, response regulator
MKIRALIVDDEALARHRLRKLLADAADLEIIGEASNGPEAIALIRDQRPDLVFLDVQMPEVSGFDVLRALPEETWPAVVFVTAHDRHAVEAFNVHALDYLLKPFTQARLLAAVQRAREHLEARNLGAINQQLAAWLKASKPESPYLSRIAVRNGSQTLFIRVEDLDYIESVGNYAVLHTRAENHIVRETLTSLETKLPPALFLRISRSILVNLERVKGLQATPRGEYLVVLQDDRQLMMTRGLKEIQTRLQYPDAPATDSSPAH